MYRLALSLTASQHFITLNIKPPLIREEWLASADLGGPGPAGHRFTWTADWPGTSEGREHALSQVVPPAAALMTSAFAHLQGLMCNWNSKFKRARLRLTGPQKNSNSWAMQIDCKFFCFFCFLFKSLNSLKCSKLRYHGIWKDHGT